ncbi:MAG: hypothetical protein EOP84_18140 [Verrucomicrobiaceae bacterium]|nr:MAG: hypothetical protein EOP84_18140 [Verrucomicrobiaceae bacterium]
MQQFRLSTLLISAFGLFLGAGCATRTPPPAPSAPQQYNYTSDKDGRYFNPISRNFDAPPPFGARGNS